MHCGFLERDDWRAPGPIPIGGYQGDTCPGFFSSLPQMREAELARFALEHHALPLYFPNNESVILLAAAELQVAVNIYQNEKLKEQQANIG